MTTLQDMALTCAKQIGRASADGSSIIALESEIKDEIRNTIKHYNRKSWSLTEVVGFTFPTSAGFNWYRTANVSNGDGDQALSGRFSVPIGDILAINYMRTNPGASGLNEPLERISYHRFEELFEGSTPSGIPVWYTIRAGQIGLWPTPSAQYTVYGSGSVKPVVPTADTDTSVWFDQANELIEAGALKRVCVKHTRDRERAAQFEVMERDQMMAMSGETMKRSSTGKIRASW